MFNKVTIRQQHRQRCSTLSKKTMMTTTTTAKRLSMLVAFMLILNASSWAATLAESEINDLNSIETKNETTVDSTATVKQTQPETRQYPYNGFMMPSALPVPSVPSSLLPGCPLCDSSVYSYCSHKLIHDSCCCDFPGTSVYQKPPQCAYNDCSLLYAKSCYEHSLIKNCCCNNPY
ncbi:uncharacterized protein LOC124418934 isoform X3 [Lucilia cuprina]|uniref:uncharacterized protein LOC124418934 isoform X2 n=1 Tax=Lucilia cuprina TaxID=7375 RepID=UPI001F063016|nr:uncharacterized protein LOC124418934 isoform X2 [Lucilia cuprina]XP_046802865.1 uncharacterized protein LOC124418934 isoform X3 [Lucilia cuprina]